MNANRVCREVIELVKVTGSFIQEESRQFDLSNIEYKGFNNLVSYVDKETEKKLVKGLKEIFPEAAFITEEGTVDQKKEQDEFYWLVDPLDGTTNYLHKVPIYSTSIALMQGNELVLGVVFDMNRDECFHAVKGQGAYCNDKKIQVSPYTELSRALLATGFPYFSFEKMPDYIKIAQHFMEHCHGLRRCGSAAIDLAWVACGRFEGYFEYNIQSYDVAAGALLVEEAGGRVTDFAGGNNYIFGNQIIAGGHVQPAMVEAIGLYW